ncbi:MAG TPA: prepilin peptidase [Roseiflexaceae bacterium]|nr:prepilin peptidase [Roseiflexaceae bacterium]
MSAVAGLVIGMLLNRVIIRLTREAALIGAPHCTRCGRRMASWQYLPLFGWLIQGGKARCCGRRLHWMFPLVEFLMAVSLVVLAQRYLATGMVATFAYLGVVVAILLVTGAIDWFHRFIYTLIMLGATLAALIASPFIAGHNLIDAVVGAVIAGIAFVFFYVLAKLLFPGHAAPFGLGDVYLGIFIGAALGLTHLMPALFYGMLLAGLFSAAILIQRRRATNTGSPYISYGSFLCIGAVIYILIWGI